MWLRWVEQVLLNGEGIGLYNSEEVSTVTVKALWQNKEGVRTTCLITDFSVGKVVKLEIGQNLKEYRYINLKAQQWKSTMIPIERLK